MALFVNKLGLETRSGRWINLGLLVLPVIIRTTEEALKAVDDTFRQASLALGASKGKLQANRISDRISNIITFDFVYRRVSGETAPILFTVAAYFT
jgi:phosphate transport system permease protein